jgi:hypothetical protein
MRLKSRNLWTCTVLHASHNLFIQRFFDPMTADTGRTRYFIGEFGAVLPLVTIGFAFYFWTRRHELPEPTVPSLGNPEADQYLKPAFRKGWELKL